jgi:hypothetical protein
MDWVSHASFRIGIYSFTEAPKFISLTNYKTETLYKIKSTFLDTMEPEGSPAQQ